MSAQTLDAARIRDLLATAGITPTREVIECRDARRRPGNAPSWLVVLENGATVPAVIWERCNVYRDGNRIMIIQFKEG